MNLEQAINYAKTLINLCTKLGDITIDATVGNGNDTIFLSQIVKETGVVFGFDIQQQAIENTRKILNENNIKNVQLFQIGHEHLQEYIPIKYHGKIASAVFNLGYLPKGNKNITTKGTTTISAIKQLLDILKINGLIVLVVYPGHEEGRLEKEELLEYLSTLDQKVTQVLTYQFINQVNDAPFLIAIEKLK